jgi:hypothetical protein
VAYLAREEVEVGRVEGVALGKVGDAHAKVPELVDGCWAFLEALILVGAAVLLSRLGGVSMCVHPNCGINVAPENRSWRRNSHS